MAENKKSFLGKVLDGFRRFGQWFKKQNRAVQAVVIIAGLLIIGIPIKASESGNSATTSNQTATKVATQNPYDKYEMRILDNGRVGISLYAKLDLNGDYKAQVKEIIPAITEKFKTKKVYTILTDNIYKTKPVEQELLDMNDGIDIWSDKEYIDVATYHPEQFGGAEPKTLLWLYPIIDGGSEKFEF